MTTTRWNGEYPIAIMALRVTNNEYTEIDGGGKRAAPSRKRASNGRIKWGGGVVRRQKSKPSWITARTLYKDSPNALQQAQHSLIAPSLRITSPKEISGARKACLLKELACLRARIIGVAFSLRLTRKEAWSQGALRIQVSRARKKPYCAFPVGFLVYYGKEFLSSAKLMIRKSYQLPLRIIIRSQKMRKCT